MTLTARDICMIIKSAALSKVSFLRFGEFEVHFTSLDASEENSADHRPFEVEPSEPLHDEAFNKYREEKKIIDEEDELYRLQIEDPSEYERIISMRVQDA